MVDSMLEQVVELAALTNLTYSDPVVSEFVHRNLEEETIELTFYQNNKGWIRPVVIILGIQAFIGFIAIEYAFSRIKRMRVVDEERDS